MRATLSVLAAALLASAAARAQDRVLDGDPVNGGRLYRLNCAACHGGDGRGGGPLAAGLTPKPGDVRDGGLLWSVPASDLLRVFAEGGAAADKALSMPAHSRSLSLLDQRDILAWLSAPVPRLEWFFPTASDYIAHRQTIDQYGRQRALERMGEPLPEEDARLMVYTVFKPEDGKKTPEGGPRIIPEEPRALYAAKPKRKLGFVTYVPLRLDDGTVHAAFSLSRSMVLWKLTTIGGGDAKYEALRQKVEPLLKSFEGCGGREYKRPVEPQNGMKVPKDVQREMMRAYMRTLEAVAMYEKEERERFWADPDAFKGTEVLDPGEVKFDMKNTTEDAKARGGKKK